MSLLRPHNPKWLHAGPSTKECATIWILVHWNKTNVCWWNQASALLERRNIEFLVKWENRGESTGSLYPKTAIIWGAAHKYLTWVHRRIARSLPKRWRYITKTCNQMSKSGHRSNPTWWSWTEQKNTTTPTPPPPLPANSKKHKQHPQRWIGKP